MKYKFIKKIYKIAYAVKTEGIFDYSKRIFLLGRYRYWIKRVTDITNRKATILNIPVCVSNRKEGLTEELLLYGIHEPFSTDAYNNTLKPGMQVLDVGTNIGYYILVAANAIGDSGKIIGFEPDKELYECAIKNSSLSECPVSIYNIAVSDTTEKINFYKSEVANWGSIVKNQTLKPSQTVTVDATSIDEFCKKHNFIPNVIRMDIEGGELKALEGGVNTLNSYSPFLFIEFHKFLFTSSEIESFFQILRNSGYNEFTVINRYYDFPWALKTARAIAEQKMELEDLLKYLQSDKAPNVVSILSQ